MKAVTVVIPALNEAGTISKVVSSLVECGFKVLVVDDGSTDETGTLALAVGARLVRHQKPRGYDASVAEGLNVAFAEGANFVISSDADGQHRPEDIQLCAQILNLWKVDLCSGERDKYNRPMEFLTGLVSRTIFKTKDPFCGLKGYSRRFFEEAGPFPFSMSIGTWPLAQAYQLGLKTYFFPIQVLKRFDEPRFAIGIKGNLKLFSAFVSTLRRALLFQ